MGNRVLIIRNAYSYDFGGAERLAIFLARELVEGGIDPFVVSRHTKVLDFARQHDIETVRGPWLSRQGWNGVWILLFPLYVLWQVYLLGWYLRCISTEKVDAIHVMSRDDFIAATLAGKLLRKPVVWTDCADLKFVYENHPVWFKNPVGKLVYWASKKASNVTTVSRNELRLIEQSLGHSAPENYMVVYMVGRDEAVSPTRRKERDVVFCATSRLVTDKGIRELIEAFNTVSTKISKCYLWMIGDGPEAETFKALAADNKRIIFLGHQTNPLSYLAATDIYVHPTYHEGFSLGLAEAAMLAKGIIATNVGGNPEIIEHEKTGLLVPIKNTDELAAAMYRLASDKPLRDSMGQEAREKFVNNFDLSKVVKEIVAPLYENKN